LAIKQQRTAWSQLSAKVKHERWRSVPSDQVTCSLTDHSELNVVGAHQSQITKCSHPGLVFVFLCYAKHLLWHRQDKFWYKNPVPIDTIRLFYIYQSVAAI